MFWGIGSGNVKNCEKCILLVAALGDLLVVCLQQTEYGCFSLFHTLVKPDASVIAMFKVTSAIRG
jgi:hypothetical protein